MSASETIADFAYILEDKTGRYALVQSKIGSSELETCLVYDTVDKMALIIEDNDLAMEVLKRFLASGALTLQGLPKP